MGRERSWNPLEMNRSIVLYGDASGQDCSVSWMQSIAFAMRSHPYVHTRIYVLQLRNYRALMRGQTRPIERAVRRAINFARRSIRSRNTAKTRLHVLMELVMLQVTRWTSANKWEVSRLAYRISISVLSTCKNWSHFSWTMVRWEEFGRIDQTSGEI